MLRMVSVVLLCILISDANKYNKGSNHEEWKEFEEFLEWKKARQSLEYNKAIRSNDDRQDRDRNIMDPPSINHTALMARYVVNQADWTSVATISTRKDIETFPVTNLISFSDGPLGNGTGIPYMYLTPLDYTAQDLARDHRASLLMSLQQGSYCKNKDWDPMDPRCARVILTGKIQALKNTSAEMEVAKQAVFGRHPHLKNLPADHYFFFAKMKIIAVALLDTFGGPKYITVKDYFHPPTMRTTSKKHYNDNKIFTYRSIF